MRGDEVQELQADRPMPNPLYIPNKVIIVNLEFPSDDLSINEVLSLLPPDIREHLTAIHVRDRRFD